MSERLRALTARRAALEAEVALQRDEVTESYRSIAGTAARADQAVASVRRLGPWLVLAGVVGLAALGPARAVSLLRRGLTLGLYATQARRLIG